MSEGTVTLEENQTDKEYFRLLKEAINGPRKKNRTGVDTFGVFGEQAKFDVRMDAFPILTTKKVWFKGIVHELLWFLSGDTNIKYLVDNDVHIWDEWAYKRYADVPLEKLKHEDMRLAPPPDWMACCSASYIRHTQEEFIQRIKEDPEFAEKWGELGEGTYGGMWRDFPFFTCTEEGHYPKGEKEGIKGMYCESWFFGRVDQITLVLNKLKTNPDDRRMIVSAWHPYWVDHCALPPCHCLFHFNTEELTFEERLETVRQRNPGVSSFDGQGGIGSLEVVAQEPGWLDRGGMIYGEPRPYPSRRLNLLLYQRSCDTFLGVPFNITSYSLLLAMVAHCSNMVPGTFTHTFGDLHVYENHMKQVAQQLMRDPYPLPKLWLNPEKRDLFKFTFEDIKLVDYKSHPTIKAPIAV